jgi:hypothetical protein
MITGFIFVLTFVYSTTFAKGLDDLEPSAAPEPVQELQSESSDDAQPQTPIQEEETVPGENTNPAVVKPKEGTDEDTQMQASSEPIGISSSLTLDLYSFVKIKDKSLKGLGGSNIQVLTMDPVVEGAGSPLLKHFYGISYSSFHAYYQKDTESSFDLFANQYALAYLARFSMADNFCLNAGIDFGYQEFKLVSADRSLRVLKVKDQAFVALIPSATWYFDRIQVGPRINYVPGEVTYFSLGVLLGVDF